LPNSKLADKGSPNGKYGFLADNFRNVRGDALFLIRGRDGLKEPANIDRGFRFVDAPPRNEPATLTTNTAAGSLVHLSGAHIAPAGLMDPS
jgi:hypothetical protein